MLPVVPGGADPALMGPQKWGQPPVGEEERGLPYFRYSNLLR